MTECRHGLSEDCPSCAEDTIAALVKALTDSSFMLEALMQQLHSWDNEPVVNVRGQLARNRTALAGVVGGVKQP